MIRLPKNLGMLLLGIWLIATGLVQLDVVKVPYTAVVLALLAIAAGILTLLGR